MSSFLTFKRKLCLATIAVFILLNILVWKEVFVLGGPHYLKVDVLNIGQGDAIFIETPAMRHILIDGGPDSSVLGKLSQLLPFWEKHLDMVILTHPDADHLVGLLKVLGKYQVDYIVWTGMVRDGASYKEWLSLLEKQKKLGAKIIVAKAGTQILSGNATMDIVHPFEDLTGKFFGKADNDTGVVTRLVYAKRSFLFPADISSAVEQEMVVKKVNLASDVLKVAHHGSKYSSSDVFLQAVHPVFAVISVGAKNPYGHPTPEVLQRLDGFGITTLRTDQRGDIVFTSDGNGLAVNN